MFIGRDWRNGWLMGAQHYPSPNFGVRPVNGDSIDTLVIHSISLPPGEYGNRLVPIFFANELDFDAHPYFQTIRDLKVSAHFFIERSGRIWQHVSVFDRAWHAGKSIWHGRENCNDYSVGVELEGLEGLHFESAQYAALSELILHLKKIIPLRHIVGHEHIAPGRKHDPGAGFDWRRLKMDLNATQEHYFEYPPHVIT